jgi:hypothetical protein
MRTSHAFERLMHAAVLLCGAAFVALVPLPAAAQSSGGSGDVYYPPKKSRPNDAYTPPNDGSQSSLGTLNGNGAATGGGYGSGSGYNAGTPPPPPPSGYGAGSAYNSGQGGGSGNPAPVGPPDDSYGAPRNADAAPPPGYGESYHAPGDYDRGGPRPYDRDYRDGPGPYRDGPPPREWEGDHRTYSKNEIIDAGHHFFGGISQGLADVVEYAFQRQGRPNGYILGEDAGGAFVAGLRYGEGTLYTRDAGSRRVYWQGPSLGYDFGGEGSKTMVLVYNLRDPEDIYHRFGGVEGSAYVIGGVSIVFQQYGNIVLSPIRAGIGLRLGANVGYLKYTRSPTWNPF